ncbi:MAG: hypothetical protein JXQ99_17715 [Hyphomicrobiaceae bacterium]
MTNENQHGDGHRQKYLLSEIDRLRDLIDEAIDVASADELQKLLHRLRQMAAELDNLKDDATEKDD